MPRPSRASQAAKQRWSRTRRFNAVKAKIETSLRRTLCNVHYPFLDDDIYREELEEVCNLVFEAEESVEEYVDYFFPQEGISQEQIREFKRWLKNDEMGEPIKSECLPWCRFIIRSFLRCTACRKNAPTLPDAQSTGCSQFLRQSKNLFLSSVYSIL